MLLLQWFRPQQYGVSRLELFDEIVMLLCTHPCMELPHHLLLLFVELEECTTCHEVIQWSTNTLPVPFETLVRATPLTDM